VALREQVLLCAGELILETSLSYSRADTDVLLLAPPALFGHHTPAGNRSGRADRALRHYRRSAGGRQPALSISLGGGTRGGFSRPWTIHAFDLGAEKSWRPLMHPKNNLRT